VASGGTQSVFVDFDGRLGVGTGCSILAQPLSAAPTIVSTGVAPIVRRPLQIWFGRFVDAKETTESD